MKRSLFLITILALSSWVSSAKDYVLGSPDGKTIVTVSAGQDIRWSVRRGGQTVLEPSPMAVVLDDGTVLGKTPRVKSAKVVHVDKTFKTPFYHKSQVRDRYNQLVLRMAKDYSIEFRAYDSGVAYRFVTSRKGDMTVRDEQVVFRFDKDYDTFIP